MQGFTQVSLQKPSWTAIIFLALFMHLWATECGWFGLCAMTEMEVSCPAYGMALPCSPYSLSQVPVGIQWHQWSQCLLFSELGNQLRSVCPQRFLNLHLGIVMFKCSYVKQLLYAVALLAEEVSGRVTSSTKPLPQMCNSSSNLRP